MSGWKTWFAVVSGVMAGVTQIINGNYQEGIMLILAALALIGIGGKLSRIETAVKQNKK